MDKSAILRRIQKLLAIANDGRGDPNEAAAAASQAENLMRKFDLEHADVIARDLRSGAEELGTADVISNMRGDKKATPQQKIPRWAGWLAFRIAKTNDCEIRYVTREDGWTVIRFFGTASDTQVASWTFDFLVSQLVAAIRAFQRAAPRSKSESDSFRKGFVLTVCARLSEQAKARAADAAQTSAGRELVLAKSSALVAKFGAFNYGRGSDANIADSRAASRGAEAGSRVDLGTRGIGGTRSATLAIGR